MNNLNAKPLVISPLMGYLNTEYTIMDFKEGQRYVVKKDDIPVMEVASSSFMVKEPGTYHISCMGCDDDCMFIVEDAKRYGGSKNKGYFIFEEIPFAFVVMNDRTYIHNYRDEKTVLVNFIAPDDIAIVDEDNLVILFMEDQKQLAPTTSSKPYKYTIYSLLSYSVLATCMCSDVKRVDVLNRIIIDEQDEKYISYSFSSISRFIKIGECANVITTNMNQAVIKMDSGIAVYNLITGKRVLEIPLPESEMGEITNNVLKEEMTPKQTIKASIDNVLMDIKIKAKGLDAGFGSENLLPNLKGESVKISFIYCSSTMYKIERIVKYVAKSVSYRKDSESINSWISQESSSDTVNIYQWNGNCFALTYQGSGLAVDLIGWRNVIALYDKANGLIHTDDSGQIETFPAPSDWVFKSFYQIKDVPMALFDQNNSQITLNLLCDIFSKHEQTAASPSIPGEVASSNSKLVCLIARNGTLSVFAYNAQSRTYDVVSEVKGIDNLCVRNSFMSPDGSKLLCVNSMNQYCYYDVSVANGKVIMLPPKLFDSRKFVKFTKNNSFVTAMVNSSSNESRDAEIIDPETLQITKSSFYDHYVFSSPDESIYADNNIYYHYGLSDGSSLSKEEYCRLKQEIAPDLLSRDQQQTALCRRRFYDAHKKCFIRESNLLSFDEVKDDELIWLLTIWIIEQSVIVHKVDDVKDLIEIKIPNSSFINNISFSDDNQMIGIVGKPAGCSRGGIMFIAELDWNTHSSKLLFNHLAKWATWNSQFSTGNMWATYDSKTSTYFWIKGDADTGISDFKEPDICNRSFLCFSPSGKYIALSLQGYDPISLGGKGHLYSNDIFIRAVNDYHRDILHFCDHHSSLVGNSFNNGFSKKWCMCAFSDDDNKLMSLSDDGVVVIRNLHLSDSK